jgi:hypothetical protein
MGRVAVKWIQETLLHGSEAAETGVVHEHAEDAGKWSLSMTAAENLQHVLRVM